jgi:hypothetical protein
MDMPANTTLAVQHVMSEFWWYNWTWRRLDGKFLSLFPRHIIPLSREVGNIISEKEELLIPLSDHPCVSLRLFVWLHEYKRVLRTVNMLTGH